MAISGTCVTVKALGPCMVIDEAVAIAAIAQTKPTPVVVHSGVRHGSRRYTVRMRARLATMKATTIIAMLPLSNDTIAVVGILSSSALYAPIAAHRSAARNVLPIILRLASLVWPMRP